MMMMKMTVGFLLLVILELLSDDFAFLCLAGNGQNSFNNSGAFIGVNPEANQLVISPPHSGNVLINNFTELSSVKAELATAKSELQDARSQLDSTLEGVQHLQNLMHDNFGYNYNQVYLLGGDLGRSVLALTEEADGVVSWSSFSTIPQLNLYRGTYPAAGYCKKSNYVYISGGYESGSSGGIWSSGERFSLEVSSNGTLLATSWTTLSANMSYSRYFFAGSCLSDGETFMVCGGLAPGATQTCEAFNATSNQWRTVSSMNSARYGHAISLYEGNFVALGGWNGHFLNSAEWYDDQRDKFSSFPPFNLARKDFGATTVAKKLYVAGGIGADSEVPSSTEVFDGLTNLWSLLDLLIPHGRSSLSAASFQYKLLILGGNTSTVDVYNPFTNSWSTLTPLPSNHGYNTVCAVSAL